MLDNSDMNLIVELARCSLAKKPGKNNWVEEDAVGGLPEYICRIARAINRSDSTKSISQVIAIAVNRVKVWARGGGGVTAKTRAKAAKAVAEWERKKKAAKLDNKVKASNGEKDIILYLANSYNIDDVRRQYKEGSRLSNGSYRWVREMWSDYMIVAEESESSPMKFYKVSYSVDKQGQATFADPVEVKQAFIKASHEDLQTVLTDAQLEKASLIPCTEKDRGSLTEMVALSSQRKNDKLIAAFADKPNVSAVLKLAQEL